MQRAVHRQLVVRSEHSQSGSSAQCHRLKQSTSEKIHTFTFLIFSLSCFSEFLHVLIVILNAKSSQHQPRAARQPRAIEASGNMRRLQKNL